MSDFDERNAKALERIADSLERNAKSFERAAESLEAISLFLTVLMGEDQAEQAGPAKFIETQDGIVELR